MLGTGTSALRFVYWWSLAYLHNTGLQNTDEADVQEPTQLSWQGARPSAMWPRVQVPRRTLTSVVALAAILGPSLLRDAYAAAMIIQKPA